MFTRCCLALNRTVAAGPKTAWEPVSASVNLQCVRWRKSRHDPPPKHKVLVKRRPVPNEWEDSFLLTKYRNYRTHLKGVRGIIVKQVAAVAARDEVVRLTNKSEEEFPAILEWNEQENKKIGAIRELKLAEQAKKVEEERLEKMMQEEEERLEHLQYIEQVVMKEKEASKFFITSENMEESIEAAINNPKNYNFGINRQGDLQVPEDTAWQELRERVQGHDKKASSSSATES